MLRNDTPYIVVPMETMDRMLQQLMLYRGCCPEHLKADLEFAIKRFKETALYMHGKDNVSAIVRPANYV